MAKLKRFYLAMMVLGTIVPWFFFAQFFASYGPDPGFFVKNLFINGAAAGFSTDVVLSLMVFLVWSFDDARIHRVRRWWLIVPASLFVGLSLALPLYLYLRAETAGQFFRSD